SLQLCGVGQDRTVVVALGVRLRGAHIALGIAGVVAIPISDGSARDACLEYVRRFHHRHASHVSAIAPAVHPYAVSIHVWQLRESPDASYLVVDLNGAHAVCDRRFESEPTVRAAAVVELQDHVALLREVLRTQVNGHGPVVCDTLGVWAAIYGDDQRVSSARL